MHIILNMSLGCAPKCTWMSLTPCTTVGVSFAGVTRRRRIWPHVSAKQLSLFPRPQRLCKRHQTPASKADGVECVCLLRVLFFRVGLRETSKEHRHFVGPSTLSKPRCWGGGGLIEAATAGTLRGPSLPAARRNCSVLVLGNCVPNETSIQSAQIQRVLSGPVCDQHDCSFCGSFKFVPLGELLKFAPIKCSLLNSTVLPLPKESRW